MRGRPPPSTTANPFARMSAFAASGSLLHRASAPPERVTCASVSGASGARAGLTTVAATGSQYVQSGSFGRGAADVTGRGGGGATTTGGGASRPHAADAKSADPRT